MSTPVEHRPGTHASSGLSRRRALSGLAVSGLGLALASRGVVARQPSPAAGGIPDLLQRWADSFSTSPEAVGALYTDDGVFEDVTTLAKSEPGGVAEFVGEFMAQVSDLRYDLTAGFRTDTWGMAEGTYSFRYTGQLPGLPPGTGEAVATRFATVFELVGDKIRRSSDYSDGTGFLVAVGILPGAPPPATPATPGA